eukprot:scaffold151457_cov17-Tisochrysis_lutea.AAC.1
MLLSLRPKAGAAGLEGLNRIKSGLLCAAEGASVSPLATCKLFLELIGYEGAGCVERDGVVCIEFDPCCTAAAVVSPSAATEGAGDGLEPSAVGCVDASFPLPAATGEGLESWDGGEGFGGE